MLHRAEASVGGLSFLSHRVVGGFGVSAVALALSAVAASGQTRAIEAPSEQALVMPRPAGAAAASLLANRADTRAWSPNRSLQLDALDARMLIEQDEIADLEPGTPVRVAIMRPAEVAGRAVTPAERGQWTRQPDGSHVWRLRIDSPGALGLRLHFMSFDLPAGARLLVAGSDAQGVPQTYEKTGPLGSGRFWSNTMAGESVYLEYHAPADVTVAPVIEIQDILHSYREQAAPWAAQPFNDGSSGELKCHEDVMCYPDVSASVRDSVALIFFVRDGGGYICSGNLLNDLDPATQTGWFLTANHCIDDPAVAATVEAYWFWQRTGCGQTLPLGSQLPRSLGAQLAATSWQTDFTLLRFYEEPHDGQTFAGWTTELPVAADGPFIGVHHPRGSFKRVTFSTQPQQNFPGTCLPIAQFYYTRAYAGRAEPGSSGSPLFNSRGQVVGQLFGVCLGGPVTGASCDLNRHPDHIYGRFSRSWQLGDLGQFLAQGSRDDIYEPNNTLAQSRVLSVGSHILQLLDNNDFFTITIPETSRVTLRADFDMQVVDLDLYLLDSTGREIETSRGRFSAETISRLLRPGAYIVRTHRSAGVGGQYALAVRIEPVVRGDLNADGLVDARDIMVLLTNYDRRCAQIAMELCPDFDNDGVVRLGDLNIVLREMGLRHEEQSKKAWKRQMKALLTEAVSRLGNGPQSKPMSPKAERKLNLRRLMEVRQ